MHQSPTDDGANAPISHFEIEFTPMHETATTVEEIADPALGAGSFVVAARPEDAARELRAGAAA